MKYFFSFLFTFFFVFNVFSTSKLSEKAEISLLTCDAGAELYVAFGHSAFRVQDSTNQIDWVYNYGTFNFNTENFYVKFCRGQLPYFVSVSSFEHFINSYIEENRGIFEQQLNLTQEQKQKIFDFLEWNRLPENKFYHYDFFFDNCASRLRDILAKQLDNQVVFDTSLYEKNTTFRDLLDQQLNENFRWESLGINLVLGQKTDNLISHWTMMFLPRYLKRAFAKAKILSDGSYKPLIKKEHFYFEAAKKTKNSYFFLSPNVILWNIFVILLLISGIEYHRQRIFYGIDATLFFIVGIFSVLFILLWFFTDHKTTVQNWNLIWALPTHLIVAFFLLKKEKKNYIKIYFLITSLISLTSLFVWAIIPQRFDIALIPLLLTLAFRSFNLYKIL